MCNCCNTSSSCFSTCHPSLCSICLHPVTSHKSPESVDPPHFPEFPHFLLFSESLSAFQSSTFQDALTHEPTPPSSCPILIFGDPSLKSQILSHYIPSFKNTPFEPYEDTSLGLSIVGSISLYTSSLTHGSQSITFLDVSSPSTKAYDPSCPTCSSFTPSLTSLYEDYYYSDLLRTSSFASDIFLLCSPFPLSSPSTFALVTDFAKSITHSVVPGYSFRSLIVVSLSSDFVDDEEPGRRFCVLFDKPDTLSLVFNQILAVEISSEYLNNEELFISSFSNLSRNIKDAIDFNFRNNFVKNFPVPRLPTQSIKSTVVNVVIAGQFYPWSNFHPFSIEFSRLASLYFSEGQKSLSSSILSRIFLHFLQILSIFDPFDPFSYLQALDSCLVFGSCLCNALLESRHLQVIKLFAKFLVKLLPCLATTSTSLQCLRPAYNHSTVHFSAFLGSLTGESLTVKCSSIPKAFTKWDNVFLIKSAGEFEGKMIDCVDVDWVINRYSTFDCDCKSLDDVGQVSTMIDLFQSRLYDPINDVYNQLHITFPNFCSICLTSLHDSSSISLVCGHALCSFCYSTCLVEGSFVTHSGSEVCRNYCVVCGSEVIESQEEVDDDVVVDVEVEDVDVITTGQISFQDDVIIESQGVKINVEIFGTPSEELTVSLIRVKNNRQVKTIKSYSITESSTIVYTPSNSDVGYSLQASLELSHEVLCSCQSFVVLASGPNYSDFSLVCVNNKVSKCGDFLFHTAKLLFSYTYNGGAEGPSVITWTRLLPNGSTELIKRKSLSEYGEDDSDCLVLDLTTDDIHCHVILEAMAVRFDGVKNSTLVRCKSSLIVVDDLYLKPISLALDRAAVSFRLRLWKRNNNGMAVGDTIILRFFDSITISDLSEAILAELNYVDVELIESTEVARGLSLRSVNSGKEFAPLLFSTLQSTQPSDLIVLSFRRFRAHILNLSSDFYFSRFTSVTNRMKEMVNPLLKRRC
ncbi:hypothetical protein RCL1_006080 [Eukaryota sp. TZLM3-RCL]